MPKILENSIPLGNNSQTSKVLFSWRKYYQDSVYPSDVPEPLDMWYLNPLYGIVDLEGNAVRPLTERIIPLNDKVATFDFVDLAWADLSSQVELLIKQRRISSKNSFIGSLKIKEAWKNFEEQEDTFLNLLYDSFVKNYLALRPERLERVNSQKRFMAELERFIELYGSIIPISRTSLTFSQNYDIQHSGLALDMDLGQDSDDFDKAKIINDPNFATFSKLCQKYGFFIDKHAPWRLVADIGALGLKPYLEAVGTKYEEIFETHFSRPHLEDISVLESNVFQLFAKMKREYSHIRSCGDLNLSMQEWLSFYYKLRLSESKIKQSTNKTFLEVDKILKIYKHRDYVRAVNFINKNTIPVLTEG